MTITVGANGILQPPFAETSDIATWLPALLKGAPDFSETTHPKKSQVKIYLDWIANQILFRLQCAGYKIPLCVLDGETWPEHQNTYLQYLTVLGVAQWAGKWVNLPAPASPGNEPNRGNIFEEAFFKELDKIWDGSNTNARFRACYDLGTAAEFALCEPTPPMLTFCEPMGMANSSHNLYTYSINKELLLAFHTAFGVPVRVELFDDGKGFDSIGRLFGDTFAFPLDPRTLVLGDPHILRS